MFVSMRVNDDVSFTDNWSPCVHNGLQNTVMALQVTLSIQQEKYTSEYAMTWMKIDNDVRNNRNYTIIT